MVSSKDKKKTFEQISQDFFELVNETFYSKTVYTREQYVQIIFDLGRFVRGMEEAHNDEISRLNVKIAKAEFKNGRLQQYYDSLPDWE